MLHMTNGRYLHAEHTGGLPSNCPVYPQIDGDTLPVFEVLRT
jgi:hypothetical protein